MLCPAVFKVAAITALLLTPDFAFQICLMASCAYTGFWLFISLTTPPMTLPDCPTTVPDEVNADDSALLKMPPSDVAFWLAAEGALETVPNTVLGPPKALPRALPMVDSMPPCSCGATVAPPCAVYVAAIAGDGLPNAAFAKEPTAPNSLDAAPVARSTAPVAASVTSPIPLFARSTAPPTALSNKDGSSPLPYVWSEVQPFYVADWVAMSWPTSIEELPASFAASTSPGTPSSASCSIVWLFSAVFGSFSRQATSSGTSSYCHTSESSACFSAS